MLYNQVVERGGSGKIVPVVCDHACDESIEELFKKVASENDGQLDVLVNNAYSAVNVRI